MVHVLILFQDVDVILECQVTMKDIFTDSCQKVRLFLSQLAVHDGFILSFIQFFRRSVTLLLNVRDTS